MINNSIRTPIKDPYGSVKATISRRPTKLAEEPGDMYKGIKNMEKLDETRYQYTAC